MEATEERYVIVTQTVNEGPTIAIDLGTSYAYVAVTIDGKMEILTHSNGEKAFPCYVSFTETDRLIGIEAKNQAIENAKNTIFDMKRLIGRSFNDPLVQENLKRWPFKVESDQQNRPVIVVTYKGETKRYHPEEIMAMILIRLKEAAEKRLGFSVKKAVITVPAYFREGQRQATRDAATIAGLTVKRLLNEASASAIAYGMSQNFPKGEIKVLVYEFGAGAFDVSVVNIEDGFIQVMSTVGDTLLGAEDFDNRLVDHCLEQFKKKSGRDLKDQWMSLQKLKRDCARVRKVLSSKEEDCINIESLIEGHNFSHHITRKQWQELCKPIVNRTVDLVGKALKDAHAEAKDIKMVILAGGATHSPIVGEVVQGLFPDVKLTNTMDKDQVVIHGAGLLAADLDNPKEGQNQVLLINVQPISLGFEGENGQMLVLIPRDTSIPTMRTHRFTTTEDNQEGILVTVFEGESKIAKENHVLGTFMLGGILPAPKGTVSIEVQFHVDADGILTVKAFDTTATKELETPVLKWTLSRLEVEKLRESGFYYEQTKMPKKPSHLDEID